MFQPAALTQVGAPLRVRPSAFQSDTEPMTNDKVPAIRIIMMPRDTNAMGTIFGGIILSYIDLAGAVEARRTSSQAFVTIAMREVVFHAPVLVGDLVTFYTETVRVGRTSITTKVTVSACARDGAGDVRLVTEAEVVYVAVDDSRKPVPIVVSDSPAVIEPDAEG